MLFVAAKSHAQPIADNDFRVDLSQGLVLSGSRIVGLAGAFTALGTGIDGAAYNPASYAARDMWEHRRFTWGTTLGLSVPGRFGTDDYFNANRTEGLDIEDSIYFDLGLRVQVGYGAGGVLGTFQQYQLATTDDAGTITNYNVRFGTVYFGVAAAVFREALVVGAGLRVALLDVRELGAGPGRQLVSFSGFAPQFGAIIRPEGERYRIGASVNLPVSSSVADGSEGVQIIGEHYLPRSVNLPWQATVGFAYQIGERPMNVHWTRREDPEIRANTERDARRCARIREALAVEHVHRDDERSAAPLAPAETLPHPPTCGDLRMPSSAAFWAEEASLRQAEDERFDDRVDEISDEINLERWRRYDEMPRRHLILSVDVGVMGAVKDAIGVDAFLDQDRRPRIDHPTPTIAVGMEGEPWRNRLKVRFGSYVEPARNRGVTYRVHATGGADLRLFRWALFEDNPWDFRVGFVFDVTQDYTNFGATVGFWH